MTVADKAGRFTANKIVRAHRAPLQAFLLVRFDVSRDLPILMRIYYMYWLIRPRSTSADSFRTLLHLSPGGGL